MKYLHTAFLAVLCAVSLIPVLAQNEAPAQPMPLSSPAGDSDIPVASSNVLETVERFRKATASNVSIGSMRNLCTIANGLSGEFEEIRGELYEAVLAGLASIRDYTAFDALYSRVKGDVGELDYLDPCSLCDGTGYAAESCRSCRGTGMCPACGGRSNPGMGMDTGGRVRCQRCTNSGVCDRCKGAGETREKCNKCKGSGRTFAKYRASATYERSIEKVEVFMERLEARITMANAKSAAIQQALANPSATESANDLSPGTSEVVQNEQKSKATTNAPTLGSIPDGDRLPPVPFGEKVSVFKIIPMLEKCSEECEIADVTTTANALLRCDLDHELVKSKLQYHSLFKDAKTNAWKAVQLVLEKANDLETGRHLAIQTIKQASNARHVVSTFEFPEGPPFPLDSFDYKTYIQRKRSSGLEADYYVDLLWKRAFSRPHLQEWQRSGFTAIPDGLVFRIGDVEVENRGVKISVSLDNDIASRIGSIAYLGDQRYFTLFLSTVTATDVAYAEKMLEGKSKYVVSSGWMLEWCVEEGVAFNIDPRTGRKISGTEVPFKRVWPRSNLYNFGSFCEWWSSR